MATHLAFWRGAWLRTCHGPAEALKLVSGWVISAKREETRQKCLALLIGHSGRGGRL